MEENSSRLDRIEASIEALIANSATTDRKLEALIATSANMYARTDQKLAKMAEMQAKYEERLTVYEGRLKDHEEAILDGEAEHRRLLTAQIITTDNLAKVTDSLARSANRMEEIEAKLNGLIGVVDDFIRRQPKQ